MKGNKLKILHISQDKLTLKNMVSGIKNVLQEEIKYENLNGINSKVYGISKKIEENKEICINKEGYKEDIIEYNPDFVIFHGFYIFRHIFIANYLKEKKIPYFIKPHGGFNQKSQKKSWLKKFIVRKIFFDRFVINSNGLIFLNTQEQKESIYHSKKEIILPNGIKKIINIEKKIELDKINIIYLGRFDNYYKRIDILLKMIENKKEELQKMNVKFKFFGLGENIKNLEKMGDVLEINDPIYGEKKYLELLNSDIMILLSRSEGMPMSVLEAFSVGTPCFITKETGIAEWIEKYNCGWVVNDINNLWEELKYFIKEYRKNKDIYIKNTRLCSKEFLWSNIIKIYLNEYEKIMKI